MDRIFVPSMEKLQSNLVAYGLKGAYRPSPSTARILKTSGWFAGYETGLLPPSLQAAANMTMFFP